VQRDSFSKLKMLLKSLTWPDGQYQVHVRHDRIAPAFKSGAAHLQKAVMAAGGIDMLQTYQPHH
jgi:hypothetical protein